MEVQRIHESLPPNWLIQLWKISWATEEKGMKDVKSPTNWNKWFLKGLRQVVTGMQVLHHFISFCANTIKLMTITTFQDRKSYQCCYTLWDNTFSPLYYMILNSDIMWLSNRSMYPCSRPLPPSPLLAGTGTFFPFPSLFCGDGMMCCLDHFIGCKDEVLGIIDTVCECSQLILSQLLCWFGALGLNPYGLRVKTGVYTPIQLWLFLQIIVCTAFFL